MRGPLSITLLLASITYSASLTGVRDRWLDPYTLRSNPLYLHARSPPSRQLGNTPIYGSRFWKDSDISPSQTRPFRPRRRQDLDTRPTPQATGEPSALTTVFINNEKDFALLLPRPGELVSTAESDAQSFCTPGSSSGGCQNIMSDGFITASAFQRAEDNSWIQVTGCLDPSKMSMDPNDTGGQLDTRFPNGARCTFGEDGASFIELVEPALNRFCIRCCSTANDQVNCNSHRDRLGCENAIPGTYDFPELGINCA
ncbi:hypothetical protein EDB86DRAFT_2809999 [Lactarius hatsudake]|nr:hypothetical protein EDB86DRAFT_2809999 [Lactarius hatsudake]